MVYYMKKIQITGKRNKEQLLSSSLSSEPALRSCVQYQEPSEDQVVLQQSTLWVTQMKWKKR